jgi:hypothetical protein
VVQHIKLLESSGLVDTEKAGRVRTCRIEPKALETAEHRLVGTWPEGTVTDFESRYYDGTGLQFDSMAAYLEREPAETAAR